MNTRRNIPMYLICFLFSVFNLLICSGQAAENPEYIVQDSIPVAPVFSSNVVGFALQVIGNRQYVAYYDTQRCMTIATRLLSERTWQYKILPSVWACALS